MTVSPATLETFAKLSEIAYRQTGDRVEHLKALGYTLVDEIDGDKDIHCFVCSNDYDTIQVVFRGTHDLMNGKTDLEAGYKQFDFLPQHPDVHAGFGGAWGNVRFAVIEAVTNWCGYKSMPLTLQVSGHSLGAAIATLCATELSYHPLITSGWGRVEVYTFGSPRVGGEAFVAAYNKLVPNTVRAVHDDDLIPQIPAGMGYHHVDSLYHFLDSGKIVGITSTLWWKRWLNWNRVLKEDVEGTALKEHMIATYIATLTKMAGK